MKLSRITDAKGRATWCGTAKEVREALTASKGPVTHEIIEILGASGVAKLLNYSVAAAHNTARLPDPTPAKHNE